MTSDPAQLNELLTLCSHFDKDKRFMALRDLTKILLDSGLSAENSLWPNILRAYLQQLEDSSSEVQANAIKCIGDGLVQFPSFRASTVIYQLVHGLTTNKQLREVYSTCIRNLLTQSSSIDSGRLYCNSIIERVVLALESLKGYHDVSDEASTYCEVLAQTIDKFHSEDSWLPLRDKLVNVFFVLLDDVPLSATCKRKAASCLGLVASRLENEALILLADRIFNRISTVFSESLSAPNGPLQRELSQDLVSYLQCAADIAGCLESSSSVFIPLTPIVLETIKFGTRVQDGEVSTVNCDIVEAALHVLSCMADHIPNALQPILSDITKSGIELLSYNPGRYDDDEEVSIAESSSECMASVFKLDDEFNVDDFFDVNDDMDDMSWKVRKGSIKLIRSLAMSEDIATFPEGDCCAIETLWPSILKRISEPNPAVRELVYQTLTKFTTMLVSEIPLASDDQDNTEAINTLSLLDESVGSICRNVAHEFEAACNPKTAYPYQKCHEAGLILLSVLSSRVANSIVQKLPLMEKGISTALSNHRYPLTSTVLLCHFIDILATHDPNKIATLHLDSPDLFWIKLLSETTLLESNASRVVSQSLKTLSSILESLIALTPMTLSQQQQNVTKELIRILTQRLAKHNPLAEADTRVILCLVRGLRWCLTVSLWDETVNDAVREFIKRFTNEIPSRTILEAFRDILKTAIEYPSTLLKSIIHVDNDTFLMSSLVKHLQRHAGLPHENKSINIISLSILIELAEHLQLINEIACDKPIEPLVTEELLNQVVKLQDPKLIGSLLQLTARCLLAQPSFSKDIVLQTYKTVIALAFEAGSIYEDVAETVKEFYSSLASFNDSPVSHNQLLEDLNIAWKNADPSTLQSNSNECFNEDLQPKYLSSNLLNLLSDCQSIIIIKSNDVNLATFQSIIEDVLSPNPSLQSIAVCGALGERQSLELNVLESLFNLLSSQSSSVAFASSLSIGKACRREPAFLASNLAIPEKYTERNSFAVLNGTKVALQSKMPISVPVVQHVFNFLQFCSTKEFSDLNQLSICILQIIKQSVPSIETMLISALSESLDSHSRFTSAVIVALDASINSEDLSLSMFNSILAPILRLLSIDDLECRRLAYGFLTTVLISSPWLTEKQISELFNSNIEQDLQIRRELIREVDLGPFKRKTDDGLPLRLKAFEFLLATAQRLRTSELAATKSDGLVHRRKVRIRRREARVLRQNIAEKLRALATIGASDVADIQFISTEIFKQLE